MVAASAAAVAAAPAAAAAAAAVVAGRSCTALFIVPYRSDGIHLRGIPSANLIIQLLKPNAELCVSLYCVTAQAPLGGDSAAAAQRPDAIIIIQSFSSFIYFLF